MTRYEQAVLAIKRKFAKLIEQHPTKVVKLARAEAEELSKLKMHKHAVKAKPKRD